LVRRIRSHWPNTRLTIRGDGHYGRPEVMAWCEAHAVDYIFGLPGNAVLSRLLEPAADDVRTRRAESQAPVLRRYAEIRYGAKSWGCERRVSARIEATTLGLDIRCVRLRPHKLVDGRLFLGVEQIVPLPEAGTYDESSKKISQIAKLRISDQQQRRHRFLRALWQTGTKLTKLHEDQRATLQYSSISLHLHQGILLSYVVRKADSRVELQLELNEWSEPVFHQLQTLQSEFEAAYGRRLQWRERGERKRLRVQEIIEGGYLTPESSWPAIQEKLVDAMLHLNKTLRAFLDDANRSRPAQQRARLE